MTSTTLILVLAVLGIAIVAFVVTSRPNAPQYVVARGSTSNAQLISGLGNLVSGFGNLFGKIGASSSTTIDTGGQTSPTTPSGYIPPTVPAGFDTSNYTTTDGFMFEDANGNFVAG